MTRYNECGLAKLKIDSQSMMMGWVLLEANATISAGFGTRLVQIDEYFGMTQWTSASVAHSPSAVHKTDRLVVDELHGAERRGLEVHDCLFETRLARRKRARTLRGGPSGWVVRGLWGSWGLRRDSGRGGLELRIRWRCDGRRGASVAVGVAFHLSST